MPESLKEKLVELICDAKCDVDRICNESDWCDDCPAENGESNCKEEYIAGHLIANGVTVQEWISVKDRLPEKDGWYLCYIRSSAFRGAYYHTILPYDQQGFRTGYVYTDDVTHWMPLPQPPKGE